jgi:hypothetical protein
MLHHARPEATADAIESLARAGAGGGDGRP